MNPLSAAVATFFALLCIGSAHRTAALWWFWAVLCAVNVYFGVKFPRE